MEVFAAYSQYKNMVILRSSLLVYMTSTLALIFEISPQGFGLYTILVNEYFNVSGATHCPRRRDVRSLFFVSGPTLIRRNMMSCEVVPLQRLSECYPLRFTFL